MKRLIKEAYLAAMIKINPKKQISSEEKVSILVDSLANGLFNDKIHGESLTHTEVAMACDMLKEECRKRLINYANECNSVIDAKMSEMQNSLSVALRLS